jgi:tRNA(Arg) A34 adenosine deaminase TadA
MENNDEKYIKIVINIARQSAKNGNDPFGAILVYNNIIVHKSQDISVVSSNPILHAELNVISEYCSNNKIFSLDGYTLYCSAEPCIMCSGAIHWAKISRVVFGITQERLQKISGGNKKPNCKDLINIGKREIEIIGPILEEEGLKVFEEYPLIKKEIRHRKLYGDKNNPHFA